MPRALSTELIGIVLRYGLLLLKIGGSGIAEEGLFRIRLFIRRPTVEIPSDADAIDDEAIAFAAIAERLAIERVGGNRWERLLQAIGEGAVFCLPCQQACTRLYDGNPCLICRPLLHRLSGNRHHNG